MPRFAFSIISASWLEWLWLDRSKQIMCFLCMIMADPEFGKLWGSKALIFSRFSGDSAGLGHSPGRLFFSFDVSYFASTWVWLLVIEKPKHTALEEILCNILQYFLRVFFLFLDITEFSFCNTYFRDVKTDLFCQGNKSKLWASGMHFKTLQDLFRVKSVYLYPFKPLN